MTDPSDSESPSSSRPSKKWITALAWGGCGLAVLLYDFFRPQHVPEDANPTWGFGLALIAVGLVFLVFARFGRSNWTLAFRGVITVILMLGSVGYFIAINLQVMPRIARQGEARSNLSSIYIVEMEFYKEHKRYGNFDEIGLSLQGNRYTYRIDASGRPGTMIPARIGEATPDNTIVPAGISPDGQAFTATATGHIDNDDTIDQWHVNNIKQNLQNADIDDRRN